MAKIGTSILLPVALAVLGIFVHRITKRFEHRQWRSQKLVDKRLAIYDQLAPLLNDVLCYFTYVGCWRDLTPPDVVTLKRSIDKKIHLAAPLFSPAFFEACQAFQALCFETHTGWGNAARLRTSLQRRKDGLGTVWQEQWDACFSKEAPDSAEVAAAYQRVMAVFSAEIGVSTELRGR